VVGRTPLDSILAENGSRIKNWGLGMVMWSVRKGRRQDERDRREKERGIRRA